ncbi:PQQ-binding-like beta-propeller repeat protein [Kribbella sindirgiensis]|uniref:outer membrane protein assembly factor BamB family protein n=1 Tax=Kribbella sindirgiensis TaxID=1124744 RepID=UPI0013F3B39A|nr:PQQ-binding-like beta-propeller repeat protein [Kribbella sindirgiensis]
MPDAGALADELAGRYVEKWRVAYRDRYLVDVLTALEPLEQLCTDPAAVRLAAWFHRAEHTRANTEQQDAEASAQLAEELLPTYGVTAVRTAEVARLVRLTGDRAQVHDANADVLLDAVDAVLADSQYSTFASELRRDTRFDAEARREQLRTMLASERIYRTQRAHERYDEAARANLTSELELLDQLTPSVWRGWQRTGLSVLAVLAAFVAFAAGAAAIGQPWQIPASESDPKWPAVVMALFAAAAVAGLWWAVRRSDRKARILTAVPAMIGLVCLVTVLLTVPRTTGASGVGQRVPLLVILSVLLILAGAAAFAATRFTPGVTRNRGQMLAALAAVVAVVLVTVYVIDPLQRAYMFSANEHVEGDRRPANLDAASVVVGSDRMWTNAGRLEFGATVATAHGIAIARGRGTVEMLDPATGKSRWRYLRANTNDDPELSVLDGGRKLLVRYDDFGYLVLDADTGRRTAGWRERTRDYDIDDNDPLITGKSVSKGSDKLYGTNFDGSNRWTYEPGRCTSMSAEAIAGMVVVGLARSCGNAPDQLIGLDVKSGKKRWIRDGSLSNLMAVGDLVVGVDGDGDGRKSRKLTAIDPSSGAVRWVSDLPSDRNCSVQLKPAADRVVLLSCPSLAERAIGTLVQYVDAADGRVVSAAKVGFAAGIRYAVTPGGRVFLMDNENVCRIAKISEGAQVEYVDLDRSVTCRQGVIAAGELILVSGRDGLIALR